jgi:hypothetical protein
LFSVIGDRYFLNAEVVWWHTGVFFYLEGDVFTIEEIRLIWILAGIELVFAFASFLEKFSNS